VAAVSVGIFGGAFDPPHLGHVELARAGIEQFALGRLLVRVVEQPGHKAISTPAAIRLRLAELAFALLPEAVVSLDPWHGASPQLTLARPGEAPEAVAVAAANPYRLELEDVSRAIRTGSAPRLGRADALGQARTIEKLYAAAGS